MHGTRVETCLRHCHCGGLSRSGSSMYLVNLLNTLIISCELVYARDVKLGIDVENKLGIYVAMASLKKKTIFRLKII